MELQSVHELLQLALSKEKATVRFYHNLSSQMENASTQSLFEVLVQQELGHVRQLELELEKLGYTVKPMPPEEEIDERETDPFDTRIQLEGDASAMTFLDGLSLAIEKERASFQLYTQLLSETQDMELRKIVMALAEEEMRHMLQFEREYEALTHRHED